MYIYYYMYIYIYTVHNKYIQIYCRIFMICFEHFRTLFLNVHVEIVGDNGMSWDNPLRFGDLPSNSGTIGWVKSQTKKLGH
jgi:hypothetical protein